MQAFTSKKRGAFSVIETIIVVAIIVLLSAVVMSGATVARNKAYFSRATEEFKSLSAALELYSQSHSGDYPADVSRDLPAGIETYLAGGAVASWPDAPWPGSVYDWDNWDNPDTPGEKIYQISIRFCPAGGPLSACKFPSEAWAAGFGVNSAVYWCISGVCRPHIDESVSYPGYCVNCDTP